MTMTENLTCQQRELVITRLFNAPRPLVFKMFTEPEHLCQWWGPQDWTTTIKTFDLRPGGEWHYCMKSNLDGLEGCGKAVFREIVPPERIVYMDYFADAEGQVIEGMPETLMTLEFTEQAGKTLLTARSLFASAEERQALEEMGMVEGFSQSLDRLVAVLLTAQLT